MNKTSPTNNAENTWERYVASWNATGIAEKERLVETSVASDCKYADPVGKASSRAELVTVMLNFHAQVPGGHFVTQQFLSHNQRSVASWEMKNGAGQTLATGISYGEYDEAGTLVQISGFYELPSA